MIAMEDQKPQQESKKLKVKLLFGMWLDGQYHPAGDEVEMDESLAEAWKTHVSVLGEADMTSVTMDVKQSQGKRKG